MNIFVTVGIVGAMIYIICAKMKFNGRTWENAQ